MSSQTLAISDCAVAYGFPVSRMWVVPVTLLVSLTGCAGGGESPAPASERSIAKYSTAEELGQAISAATAKQKSAKLTLKEKSADSTGTYLEGPRGAAIDVKMSMQGQDARMVAMDGVAYLRYPDGMLPDPAKPWIKITADGTDAASKMLGPTMVTLQDNANVGLTLTDAKDAATMGPVIAERTNNVTAIRYEVTVDVQKLAATIKDPVRKTAQERAVQFGAKQRTLYIWIDERDLPVRFDTRTDGETPGKSVSFSAWGTPVDIKAPPAEQITELPGN